MQAGLVLLREFEKAPSESQRRVGGTSDEHLASNMGSGRYRKPSLPGLLGSQDETLAEDNDELEEVGDPN